jgi:hypothetical protein
MITFKSVLNLLLPKQLGIIGAAMDFFGLTPDPPPAPDFTGAAEATAAANLELAQQALEANRYDIFSPIGSQTWTQETTPTFDQEAYEQALANWTATSTSGGTWNPMVPKSEQPTPEDFTTYTDRWTKNIDLSPEGQELFEKNIATQLGMADIGLMGLDQMRDIFSTPFQLDDFEGYREDVYDAMLDRLETDVARDWDTRNAELYAAGIGRGTEAYEWEQKMRDSQLNDARLQAHISATDQALRERGRVVEEALLERQTPLNELSAFRTGSQVMMPQFETQPGMPTVSGPDYLGATGERAQYDLAGYNADVMAANQLLGGLFSLGAGGLAGGYF